MGNALDWNPLKLPWPSEAQLDIRDEISEAELEGFSFNPLDFQIFDRLPYAMGNVTDEGTPVYANNSFGELTGIQRDDIKERKLWEVPCWTFVDFRPEQIIETIRRVDFLRSQGPLQTGTRRRPT